MAIGPEATGTLGDPVGVTIMGFQGLDPTAMRELSSRSALVARGANGIAERTASLIAAHQLDEFAGELDAWFTRIRGDLTDLAELTERKTADMERVASGAWAVTVGELPETNPDPPSPNSPLVQVVAPLVQRLAALEAIRADINDNDDLSMSPQELNAVLDRLNDLSDEDRAWVLGHLTDEELDRLYFNMYTKSGLPFMRWGLQQKVAMFVIIESLPDDVRARFVAAEARFAARDDPAALAAIEDLENSEGYQLADDQQKIALMSQARNYPNEQSIDNLERLASKDWARDFKLDDFQRSAKMVAYMPTHQGGDREILNNTMDSFLAEDAPYRFDWDADGENFGQALDGVFHLNRIYLDPGNASVENSVPKGVDPSETILLVTQAVAHEVNHLRNAFRVGESYDYFMAEYRAFYVGFKAQHGRPPTRAEARDQITFMLTTVDPNHAYSNIANALWGLIEGPKIAEFVSQMLGEYVPPDDLIEKLEHVSDGKKPAPEPVSVDGGPNNLDNAP